MRNTQITADRNPSPKPVSARRAATYQRPASGSMLPERFFDSRVKLAAVCPETALMYAVLEDAFLCFHKQFEKEPKFILSKPRLLSRAQLNGVSKGGEHPLWSRAGSKSRSRIKLIERAREAEEWFFSDETRWLFSFLSVCAALGLEPHFIRKKLRQWPPACLDIAPTTR